MRVEKFVFQVTFVPDIVQDFLVNYLTVMSIGGSGLRPDPQVLVWFPNALVVEEQEGVSDGCWWEE